MTQYQPKRVIIFALSLFFCCQATTSDCMFKQLLNNRLIKEKQKKLSQQGDNPVFSINPKKDFTRSLMTTVYYLKNNTRVIKTYNKKGRELTQIIQFPNETVPIIVIETPTQKE